MNWAHIHLLLNHVPIITTVIATGLILWSLFRKDQVCLRISLALFAVAAVAVLPVYLLGENASEFLQNAAGIAEDDIEPHEEFALFAFIPVLVTGILSVFSMFFQIKNKKYPHLIIGIIVFLAFISNIMLGITANMGGKIRHTELRSNSDTLKITNEKDDD